jgi:putative restriction endonuclease
MALCVLPHKLFDFGAFTLGKGDNYLVSDQVHGNCGFDEALRHHEARSGGPSALSGNPTRTFLPGTGEKCSRVKPGTLGAQK